MPTFQNGDVEIHYIDQGTGPAMLLIAPGGMRSEVTFWESTPWNPIEQLAGSYRVIAMDQRNAGRSTAPISADDGWTTYTNDQLALLDHLGIGRFHVAGMCIGGPYILGLIAAAPERVASAVVFQTIGLDNNREAFHAMFDDWASALAPQRPEVTAEAWASFRANMYDTDRLLFSVDDDWLPSCATPMLVLLGRDLYHPESSSRLLAERAPNAVLIEDWIESEHRPAAMAAMEQFLVDHPA